MPQHRLIRPPDGLTDVERWTGEAWIPDDGQSGLCFSGKQKGFPIAVYPTCGCDFRRDDCPHTLAINRTCARFSCSSGLPIEDPVVVEQRRQAKLAKEAAEQAKLKRQADLVTEAQALGLPIGRIDRDGLLVRWSDLPTWLRSGGA